MHNLRALGKVVMLSLVKLKPLRFDYVRLLKDDKVAALIEQIENKRLRITRKLDLLSGKIIINCELNILKSCG